MVVCHRAMDEAVRLARESGVGIVGCFRSSHCGAIGLYGRQAARGGMIGIALTHSDAFVAPHFGRRAFLGTNPICIAVPCADAEPVCVDMATSSIAFNAVMNARRDGRKLPPGVALDEQGHPTDEADEVAALTPLAGHKGYALAMLIEILCGPLSGMPFGPHISPMYGDLAARRNLGSLMMAIDPGRFAGGSYLADAVAELAAEARGQLPADGQSEVLVPGDPEYRTARRRATEGIPLEPALIDELTHESGTPLPGRPL
jgi:ureidoglycolate dehydrogenase (NAD+)